MEIRIGAGLSTDWQDHKGLETQQLGCPRSVNFLWHFQFSQLETIIKIKATSSLKSITFFFRLIWSVFINLLHARELFYGDANPPVFCCKFFPLSELIKQLILNSCTNSIFFYLPQMNQSLLGSTNIFQLTWINLWPWPVMRLVTPNPRSGGGGLTARAPSVRPRPSPSLGSARKTLACISVRPALCMGLSLPRNLMSIFFSKVRPAKWYISIDFSPSHQEITLLLFKQAE